MATTKKCVQAIVAWLRQNPNTLTIEPKLMRRMADPNDDIHRDRFGPWLWKRVSKKKLPSGNTLRIFHAPAYCYVYDSAVGLTEDAAGSIIGIENGPLQHFYDKYGIVCTQPDLAELVQIAPPTPSHFPASSSPSP